MDFSENYIQVNKTARFVALGKINERTQEVWIVLHGYAQLAADFIKPFEKIATAERVIIAPEGLNKFYAKGFGGKPSATWMTSEMREYEILDYNHYLNRLCEHLGLQNKTIKIVLLGFSQGVATASRWLHQTPLPINKFILYAGEIAAELQNPISPALLKTPLVYVTGTSDRLISSESLLLVKSFMKQLNAEEVLFVGGHEVLESVIKQLV